MQQHVRLIRATRLLERRMFLKALALGLTVPVAARLARTASAATSAAPKRFFLMYMPHGIAPEHYNPQIVGGDNTNFVLNDTNVSILGPLEQYKSYVNVYQGFKYPGGGTHTGPAFNDFLVGGLPAATGRKMHFTGTTVLRLRDGKILEEIGLDDGVKALTQLDLMKTSA